MCDFCRQTVAHLVSAVPSLLSRLFRERRRCCLSIVSGGIDDATFCDDALAAFGTTVTVCDTVLALY